MVVNLFECGRYVVHVGAGTEEHTLFEPDRFVADPVAVGAMGLGVVESRRGVLEVRPESLVAKERLTVKRKTVAGGARDSFRAQSVEHGVARGAERGGVEAHHEQMVAMARASRGPLLRMKARNRREL